MDLGTQGVTEVTENIDTQSIEQNAEGINLTDSTSGTPEGKTEVRMFTEEQVNEAVEKRLARERRRFEKDLNEKLAPYRETENVLKAGLGTESITEANLRLKEFYQEQGITLPETSSSPGLSERQIEILAKAEAEEIIEAGVEEMTSEANRLARKGWENMTNQERVVFQTLGEKLSLENQKTELKKIGVDPVILEDKGFKDFASKFKNTSVVEIHNLFNKINGKTTEKPKPIGSMTNIDSSSTVKDFYTYEESLKFTKADLDKDPALYNALVRSMAKW